MEDKGIRVASLLCETRGHTGRRPCDFCQMQVNAALATESVNWETVVYRDGPCDENGNPQTEFVHPEEPTPAALERAGKGEK